MKKSECEHFISYRLVFIPVNKHNWFPFSIPFVTIEVINVINSPLSSTHFKVRIYCSVSKISERIIFTRKYTWNWFSLELTIQWNRIKSNLFCLLWILCPFTWKEICMLYLHDRSVGFYIQIKISVGRSVGRSIWMSDCII